MAADKLAGSLGVVGGGIQVLASIGSMATGIISAKAEYETTLRELDTQSLALKRERENQIAQYQFEARQRVAQYEGEVGRVFASAATVNIAGGATVGTMLASPAMQFGEDTRMAQRTMRENEVTYRLEQGNIEYNRQAAKKQKKLAIAGAVMGSLAGIGGGGETLGNASKSLKKE